MCNHLVRISLGLTTLVSLIGCMSAPKPSLEQKTKIEILKMQEVADRGQWLRQAWPASEILFVFDIDNTVLTMPQGLGSDQWFTWQYKMQKGELQKDGLITESFDRLLEIQALLYDIAPMIPTENEVVDLINDLKGKGHTVIAVTSRGYPSAEFTLRELKRNGVVFSNDLDEKVSNELFKIDGIKADLKFANGVFFTSGSNKGVMIDHLVGKWGVPVKAVVFIDDHLKHSINVHRELREKNYHLTAFRYGHEDLLVNRFNFGQGKDIAKRQWNEVLRLCKGSLYSQLGRFLATVFVADPSKAQSQRLCRLTR